MAYRDSPGTSDRRLLQLPHLLRVIRDGAVGGEAAGQRDVVPAHRRPLQLVAVVGGHAVLDLAVVREIAEQVVDVCGLPRGAVQQGAEQVVEVAGAAVVQGAVNEGIENTLEDSLV